MRNLKRYLAVIVVVAMMVTMIAPAIAVGETSSYKYGNEALSLRALGLYKGIATNPDEFNPDLGTKLDRQTGAVMLLRLFGQEKAALSMSSEQVAQALSKFTDASSIAAWAKNSVAYATQNGVIAGVEVPAGSGKFEFQPTQPLYGKALSTLILRQLGYSSTSDFNYTEAAQKLVSVSGSSTQASVFAALGEKELIKDDLVGLAVYTTLGTSYKDGSATVLSRLVQTGMVTPDQVSAADVQKLVPTVLGTTPSPVPTTAPTTSTVTNSVYSVTAINGALSVTLGSAVAATPSASDFTVTQTIGSGTATAVTASVYVWTYGSKVGILKIPEVAKTATAQTVVYSVSYKGSAAVSSAPLTIAALPGEFAIESATALNLLQVQVVFNGEVDQDTATDVDNYTVKRGSTSRTINDASVLADNKTVILTLKDGQEYEANDAGSVTVNGVKNKAVDKTISDVSKAFVAKDSAVPELVSVTSKGFNTLSLKFSEAVKNVGAGGVDTGSYKYDFKVDDCFIVTDEDSVSDSIEATSVKSEDDYTTWTVRLTDGLTVGDHTFSLVRNGEKNVEDYAGYKATPKTLTFSVANDTVVPTVQSVKVNSQTEAIVTFSKAMDLYEGTQAYENTTSKSDYSSNVYWKKTGTSSKLAADSSSQPGGTFEKITDTQWKVNFTSNPMPADSTVTFCFFGDKTCDLKDFAGNIMSDSEVTGIAVPSAVVPTITKITAEKVNSFKVYFSTDMVNGDDNYSCCKATAYTLKDSTGSSVSGWSGTGSWNANDNYVEFSKDNGNFSEALTAGTYTLELKASKIKDSAGNFVSGVTKQIVISVTEGPDSDNIDTISMYRGTNDDSIICITFDSKMATSGDYSILDVDNWYLSVEGDTDSKYVQLDSDYIVDGPDMLDDYTVKVTLDTSKYNLSLSALNCIKLKNVADAAGNVASNGPLKKALISATPIWEAGYDISTAEAELTSTTKIEITTTRKLSSVSTQDFWIYDSNTPAGQHPSSAEYVNTEDADEAVITLETSEALATTSSITIKTVSSVSDDTCDIDEIKFKSDCSLTVTDGVRPEFDSAYVVGQNSIFVRFDKALKTPKASDFRVTIASDTDAVTPDSASVATETVDLQGETAYGIILTLSSDDDIALGDTVLLRTVSQSNILSIDSEGNKITAFTSDATVTNVTGATDLEFNKDGSGELENAFDKGDTIAVTFGGEDDSLSIYAGSWIQSIGLVSSSEIDMYSGKVGSTDVVAKIIFDSSMINNINGTVNVDVNGYVDPDNDQRLILTLATSPDVGAIDYINDDIGATLTFTSNKLLQNDAEEYMNFVNSVTCTDQFIPKNAPAKTLEAATSSYHGFTVSDNYGYTLALADIDITGGTDTNADTGLEKLVVNGVTYTVSVTGGVASVGQSGTAIGVAIASAYNVTVANGSQSDTLQLYIAAATTSGATPSYTVVDPSYSALSLVGSAITATTFTVAGSGYNYTLGLDDITIASGTDVDGDGGTEKLVINGQTYIVSVGSTGIATVSVVGSCELEATATTKAITISDDITGDTEGFILNIGAVTSGGYSTQPSFSVSNN